MSGIGLQALNSYSANVTWNVPVGAVRVQVLRNGFLLDDFDFVGGAGLSYIDYLVWQSTTYTYEVKAFDASSALVGDVAGSVTTPAQSGSFPRLYATSSFWNTPIPASPAIDPNSAAMVAKALEAYAGSANFANSDDWGKALAYANTVTRVYTVGCNLYGCGNTVTFRIPTYAHPTTGSDHHLIVIDRSAGTELDTWEGSCCWSAGSRFITNPDGWGANCAQGQHCLGAVAAGYAAFGGVVRPEEIAQGHIDHALFFATPYTRSGFIACPATNTDGIYNDPSALPEGARIQLDPSFNVDAQAWPQWEKVIAHALQTYGAYLGDSSGSLTFAGEPNINRGYNAWSLVGVPTPGSLAALPWSSFRVLQIQQC